MLAIITHLDLHAAQVDVTTVILNLELGSEDIYMKIPDGYHCNDDLHSTMVCKLKQALYRLKISSKKWNEKFTATAVKLDLVNDDCKPCLFTSK